MQWTGEEIQTRRRDAQARYHNMHHITLQKIWISEKSSVAIRRWHILGRIRCLWLVWDPQIDPPGVAMRRLNKDQLFSRINKRIILRASKCLGDLCFDRIPHIFRLTEPTVEAGIGQRKVLWTGIFMKQIQWQLQGNVRAEIRQLWEMQHFLRFCVSFGIWIAFFLRNLTRHLRRVHPSWFSCSTR